MEEKYDDSPRQLVQYNPCWPIPEDLQELLDSYLAYESSKKQIAQTLRPQGPGHGDGVCSQAIDSPR